MEHRIDNYITNKSVKELRNELREHGLRQIMSNMGEMKPIYKASKQDIRSYIQRYYVKNKQKGGRLYTRETTDVEVEPNDEFEYDDEDGIELNANFVFSVDANWVDMPEWGAPIDETLEETDPDALERIENTIEDKMYRILTEQYGLPEDSFDFIEADMNRDGERQEYIVRFEFYIHPEDAIFLRQTHQRLRNDAHNQRIRFTIHDQELNIKIRFISNELFIEPS